MPDFLGSLVSYTANRVAQERSFEMQKELQNDAQAYNTLMWNKANEYNSPFQQMMRFKSAGLNPNLIYGQMNGGLAAPTIGAGSAPSSAQSPAMSALETAQLALLGAQKDNIEADTENKQADSANKGANTDLLKTQKDHIEQYLNPYYKSLEKYNNQIGLSVAIKNWLDGYVPVEYDENGNWIGNSDNYAEEYTKMNNIFEKGKEAILSEYNLTIKDSEYIDKIFKAMVDRDLEKLNSEFANLRASNAVLQNLADEKWFQVVNFIMDKLASIFGEVAPFALGFANVKTGRMNAHTNAMNAHTNARKADSYDFKVHN